MTDSLDPPVRPEIVLQTPAKAKRVNPLRRLRSENFTLTIPMGERHHEFTLSIGRDLSDVPREIAFVGRGRSGAGLDQFLVELGVQVSRALQRRNPATGEKLS